MLEPGAELTKEEVIDFLAPRVAKWQLPDDVVFIDEVPKTSVGKFSKKTLRELRRVRAPRLRCVCPHFRGDHTR